MTGTWAGRDQWLWTWLGAGCEVAPLESGGGGLCSQGPVCSVPMEAVFGMRLRRPEHWPQQPTAQQAERACYRGGGPHLLPSEQVNANVPSVL